ncbi:MAG: ribosome biogenesis GTP-binding protein YihA/YsxC [Oscillospiraceae bacterium]|nr:ribosome biogenesis GTP-binding protein YihA/YsxC [Oscillospiraceae bacterium]
MNFTRVEFYKSYGEYKQIPPALEAEVAFSGRSNVGKSTLINKLCNRKSLARVSGVPGKTITVNFYKLDNIYMVDLPGYGYAKRSKQERERWSPLVEGYLTSGRISLLIQLIDMRHPPSKDDLQMLNYLTETKMPFVIAFTKADKLSKLKREERLAGFADEIDNFDNIRSFPFSSVTGEGVEELREIIGEYI